MRRRWEERLFFIRTRSPGMASLSSSSLTCFSVPGLWRQAQGASRVDVETPRKSVRRSRLLPASPKPTHLHPLLLIQACFLPPSSGRRIPEAAGRRLTDHLLARIGSPHWPCSRIRRLFPVNDSPQQVPARGYQSGDDRHHALQPQTPAAHWSLSKRLLLTERWGGLNIIRWGLFSRGVICLGARLPEAVEGGAGPRVMGTVSGGLEDAEEISAFQGFVSTRSCCLNLVILSLQGVDWDNRLIESSCRTALALSLS
jgi:hypothetical protein